MKRILLNVLTATLIFVVASCVDDYEDANPPRLLDAPHFEVSLSTDTITGGETLTFTVSAIDVPGGIGNLEVTNSEDLGSITIDNLESMQGNSSGEITGSFTAPTTYEEELALDFILSDGQTDEDGEDAAKSTTITKTIYIEFPADAPSFSATVDADTVIRGETRTLTIDVTNAEGGIDTIALQVNSGEIDRTGLSDLFGQESGSVDLTYTADPDYVGPVTILVRVTDNLQQRRKDEEVTFDAVYEFPAPVVELSIDQDQFKAFTEVDFSVDIEAEGGISEITATSVEITSMGETDPLGTATLAEMDVNNAIGETTATVGGTFVSEIKGFINLKVTVTDAQGRSTTESVEVIVLPCDDVDIAGMYRSVANGESGSDPEGEYTALVDTVEVSGDPGLIFEVSDLSFGLFELQGFDPEPGTIQVCETDIVAAESSNGFVTVQSGTINMDGTIEIEWDNEFGDSGSVVLTPIP